jgi:hypothetical protein
MRKQSRFTRGLWHNLKQYKYPARTEYAPKRRLSVDERTTWVLNLRVKHTNASFVLPDVVAICYYYFCDEGCGGIVDKREIKRCRLKT